jgi:hypothetical protein
MASIAAQGDAHPGAPLSVAAAIALGLVASFIQSLGLTIQRKSHLQNESLPPARRSTEWKRPLWLVGFVIFLVANVGGTVFQIGALPIVMLAPLGAVSLLYNAVLARFLLNDLLSKYMVMGTALIASGAVLIGYFGVVPSPPHSLDELLDLYARPTFVAFATIFLFLFVGVLTVSHLADWQLHTRMYRNSLPSRPQKPKHRTSHGLRGRLRRRWSAPTLAPVAEVNESSSGIATPVLAGRDEVNRRSTVGLTASPQSVVYGRTIVATPIPPLAAAPAAARDTNGDVSSASSIHKQADSNASSKRDYGSLGRSDYANARKRKRSIDVPRLELRQAEQRVDAETVRQTKLGLAVAYGGASGTLSGACLLLAKSGVELLMLTFAGQNQFGRWQSWLLIGILLAAALLQLWYLNKALKLADPTLVCPLAFCFYNTSSIALGLVYFDQIGALAWYDLVLVAVGTAVLLAGVWTVSLHGNDDLCDDDPETQPLLESPASSVRSRSSFDADYEGLLAANGAGLVGPHLPPVSVSPHSSSFVDHNVAPLTSPEEAALTLPAADGQQADSGAPRLAPRLGATPARRRFGSSGAHGQRRPTITLEFPLRDDIFSPKHDAASPAPHDVEAGAGPSSSPPRSRRAEASPEEHDSHGRRQGSLYNTILEHGLSIGISPSSPGFHLQPRSPSLSRVNSNWQRPSRHPQRSMSEADAPSTLTSHTRRRQQGSEDSVLGSVGGEVQDEDAASSGFGIALDQLDLSRRLEAVGLSAGRRWWKRLKPRWTRSRQVEPVTEETDADTSDRTVIITSNSNGSLMAAQPDDHQPTQGLGLHLSPSRESST